MTHPLLPHLDDRLAIVGQSGSGKTYTARGGVEAALGTGRRLCIIDPLDVWWGLRVGPDGTAPGHPVVIFGGRHADIPITEASGAVVGRHIAESSQSCIVSLGTLKGDASMRRFMDAFLGALYDNNRAPLLLVVDEADLLAPQNPQPGFQHLLGQMQNIVRRGRVLGFVPWLITQRPAVLSKDVLSQADVLVAMRLGIKHDRVAVQGWIEGHADRDEGARILADLPKLAVGTGYVWAPKAERLERVAFPPIGSFDSSRTPKHGETLPDVRLGALDVGAITAAIAALEAAPASQKAQHASVRKRVTEEKIAAGEERDSIYQEGYAAGETAGKARAREAFVRDLYRFREDMVDDLERFCEFWANFREPTAEETARIATLVPKTKPARPTQLLSLRETKASGPPGDVALRPRHVVGKRTMTPQQRILNALAWLEMLGHKRSLAARVAWLASASPTSGAFAGNVSAMRKAGVLDPPGGDGALALTAEGRKLAAKPTKPLTDTDLHNAIREKVSEPQWKILSALIQAHPDSVTRAVLAKAVDASPTSGAYAGNLSTLHSLGVIEFPRPGSVAAAALMFVKGR